MTKLRLAPDLALPPDAVTSTQVVYGGKGMGKTNYGSVLVEEMTKAGLRWSVLDPLGVWWGLRHSADGKGPGIECLIIGGTHGDLPLDPSNGAVVADLVAEEEGVNVVVDFSRKPTGEMWSVGDRIKFVTAYALRLFQRQGELIRGQRRPPLMQILDESARYIPQVIPAKAFALAECVGAWEQFTEEGRNVGLGVTFLTQRSARMNKSVSELADVMVAFRIVGPRSVEAVTDWLGAHVERRRANEIVEQLRSLPVGHALVVSPGWLGVEKVVHVRMRETFDSSATPKPGERRREPARGAKPDLEKYRVRMAETIERVKADDPKELHRRIAELERETAKRRFVQENVTPVMQRIEKPVEVHVISPAVLHGLEEASDKVFAAVAAAREAYTEAQALYAEVRQTLDSARALARRPAVAAPAARPVPPPRAAVPRPRADTAGGAALPPSERKILTALAQYPDGRTIRQVAILTGYKRGGGRFNNLLGSLRSAGHLERIGGGARITEAGLAALGEWEPLPTGPDLLEYWLRQLPSSEEKVLRAVADAGETTKAKLADATDYKAGGGRFNNILGKLRTLELITRGDPITLSEELV